MEASHLPSLLISVILLLAVCYVSANPRTPISKDPVQQDECSTMPLLVGYGHGLAHINLQKRQEFFLKPNMPLMRMMFQEDNVLYQTTVDGTMVNLLQCEVEGTNCITLDKGGRKSNNLLMTDDWNVIHVNYTNDEITVDVNNMAVVMGGRMRTKGSMNVNAQVTFQAPSAMPNYTAELEIPCEDKAPIIQTELPILTTSSAATTTQSSLLPRPYEKCPLYTVKIDHPSPRAVLAGSLTLAILPKHPNLQLSITGNEHIFYYKYIMKVNVHDQEVELQECEKMNKGCSIKSNVHFQESALIPEQWNNVTLSLHDDKLFININKRKKQLLTSVQSRYGNILYVVAEAPQDIYLKDGKYFEAYVNVKCEGTEQTQVWPTAPTSTEEGIPTKVPIVEVTDSPTTGISQDVAIVVGVLVGLLVLIGLAILISTIKKRRSASISERAPLQNQFQQQE